MYSTKPLNSNEHLKVTAGFFVCFLFYCSPFSFHSHPLLKFTTAPTPHLLAKNSKYGASPQRAELHMLSTWDGCI